MFFKYDRDRSGALEKKEAYDAIKSLGKYILSSHFAVILQSLSIINDSGLREGAKLDINLESW